MKRRIEGLFAGVSIIILALCLVLVSHWANAQVVYISTLGSPQPTLSKVQGAIADWNAVLPVNLTYGGTTGLACVSGGITYRMPSTSEWTAIFGANFTVLAATFQCQPENDLSGFVILLNPFLADPAQKIYGHELGHALGGHHLSDPSALMYSGTVTANSPQPADVQSVLDCLVRVDTSGVVHIPSSYIYTGYTLTPRGSEWYNTGSFSTSLYCIGNYQTNNDYALNQVLMPSGLRFNVILQPMPDGGWSLKSASQY